MFFFLLVTAFAATVNADPIRSVFAPRFPSGRIWGGENAAIESYPYQISLEKYGRHDCGGSIISAHYVITAGHCARDPAYAFIVRAGTSLEGRGGSVHQVEKVIPHEKFSFNSYGVPINDVAVLRVKEPFVFDETRQPINLYGTDEEAVPGVKSVITGWGETDKATSVQLQTVTVPIISKDLCNTAYQDFGGLPDGQICAAYYGIGGKDACQGDSGGPLAIDGRLAGIVSWGNGCAEPNYPGVYTEVAAFRDWINKHVEF